jgi:hypothetical protein
VVLVIDTPDYPNPNCFVDSKQEENLFKSDDNYCRFFTFYLLPFAVAVFHYLFRKLGFVKKDELENLLSVEIASDESSIFVFVDKTRRFNFRESAYRFYEFAGHLSSAGIKLLSLK